MSTQTEQATEKPEWEIRMERAEALARANVKSIDRLSVNIAETAALVRAVAATLQSYMEFSYTGPREPAGSPGDD